MGFLFAVLFLATGTVSPGVSLQNGEAVYREGGLFVRVVLVDDPEGFLREWMQPSADETPIIEPVTRFERGDTVLPVILYETDGLREDGEAKITYTFEFRRPDGTLYDKTEDLNVVRGRPPAGVGLFQEMSGLQIEPDDAFGEYELIARITDHVKNVTVEMPLKFMVGNPVEPAVSLFEAPTERVRTSATPPPSTSGSRVRLLNAE